MTKFWGTPAQSGSLCNLREVIRRRSVDKGVKVFNVGDEFLMHAFKNHLISSIMTNLKIDDHIPHGSATAHRQLVARNGRDIRPRHWCLQIQLTLSSRCIDRFFTTLFFMSTSGKLFGGKTVHKLSGIGNTGYHTFLPRGVQIIRQRRCGASHI